MLAAVSLLCNCTRYPLVNTMCSLYVLHKLMFMEK